MKSEVCSEIYEWKGRRYVLIYKFEVSCAWEL